MLLAAGQKVILKVENVQWQYRDAYHSKDHIKEFNEYSGTIVCDKWHGEHRIGLTTTIHKFPVRVLQRHRIVEVNGTPVNYKEAAVEVAPPYEEYTVPGSKGNTYKVTVNDGVVMCTCPGYQYRGDCKHVNSLEKLRQEKLNK